MPRSVPSRSPTWRPDRNWPPAEQRRPDGRRGCSRSSDLRAPGLRRRAARSYGQVAAAVSTTGRSHRSREADLLIAATAHVNGVVLYTRDPDDVSGLDDLVTAVGI